jgi:hypothetical protein
LNYYHAKFPIANDGSIFLDASPSYLVSAVAYKRIYQYNPKIKMIVLLRDPVDRAYSAWNMYKARYQQNRNWFFDEWISFVGGAPEQYLRRSDEELFDFALFVNNEMAHLTASTHEKIESPLLMHGLYYEHLSRFLTIFKKEQILVVESTYFRNHTAKVLEKIGSFISLPRFDWGVVDLSPIFEGGYTDAVGQSVACTLSAYYTPHNEALYSLLGVRYDWK